MSTKPTPLAAMLEDLAEQLVRMKAENDRLRAALAPFAEFLRAFDANPIRGLDPHSIYAIHTGTEWAAELRWDHLRAARAALEGK